MPDYVTNCLRGTPTKRPVAVWPMQEASGSLSDVTGHGWTGVPSGSPTYQVAGPTINGQVFVGVRVPASGSFFTIPSALEDPTPGFTLSGWAKSANTGAYGTLFHKSQTGHGGLWLRRDTSGDMQGLTRNTTDTTHLQSTAAFADGTWKWVALRYDGTTLRTYVGTLTADDATPSGTFKYDGNPNTFILGGGGTPFDGDACLLAYWDVALTDAEMAMLRTGVPLSPAGQRVEYASFPPS